MTRNILIVEDDANDIELLQAALGEVETAVGPTVVRDGAQALDYLEQCGAENGATFPKVIFLDIKMPKVDGIEVLKRIKSHDAWRRIPVVMLTSSKEAGDLRTCYDLGANAYVVKPVHFDDFIMAVRNSGTFWMLHNETTP